MTPSSVSVIVVSYNTREKLRKCLAAIEPEYELIVVDNASSDGSAEMILEAFPRTILIRNEENRGFGAANNQGEGRATAPLILYLNSDAYAKPGAISRLATVFQDETVIAAGGRLLNPDGSRQNSSANPLTLWSVLCEQLYLEKFFPRSSLFSPYWNTRKLVELPCPAKTAQVMGACLMTRSGLESFDERFFLYCEDTDLCLRLSHHGRIVYVKDASFEHDLGSSSGGDPVRGVILYNRGKELYFRIHRGAAASVFCFLLDRKGAFLRFCFWGAASMVRPSARARARGFWKAFTAPIRS
jgi:N-acetylglucosaminyl-diphospho-decaprenol L-rhamnosyltransferase